jgi:hypothetical protein
MSHLLTLVQCSESWVGFFGYFSCFWDNKIKHCRGMMKLWSSLGVDTIQRDFLPFSVHFITLNYCAKKWHREGKKCPLKSSLSSIPLTKKDLQELLRPTSNIRWSLLLHSCISRIATSEPLWPLTIKPNHEMDWEEWPCRSKKCRGS